MPPSPYPACRVAHHSVDFPIRFCRGQLLCLRGPQDLRHDERPHVNAADLHLDLRLHPAVLLKHFILRIGFLLQQVRPLPEVMNYYDDVHGFYF